MQILYLPACFMYFFMLHVIAQLCHVRIPTLVNTLILICGLMIFVCVLDLGHTGLFYRSLEWVEVNGHPVLKREYGPLHTVYPVFIIAQLLYGLGMIMYSWRKKRETARTTCIINWLVMTMMIGVYIGERAFQMTIDLIPVANVIAFGIILLQLRRVMLFDLRGYFAEYMERNEQLGFVLLSVDGRFEGADSFARRMFPELNTLPIDKPIVRTDTEFLRQVRAWTSNVTNAWTAQFYCADMVVEADFAMIGENNREYMSCIRLQDVTKRENDRKELEEALVQAKKADFAKTEFLARMSHDIRTPINGMVGLIHIMEEHSDDREIVRDGLAKTKILSHQLELLVNDVLEMSRIESGRVELTHEVFNLREVMSALAPALHVMAEEKHVDLRGGHYDIQHEMVVGSPVHLQRIAMNVLSNGIKYNRDGGTLESWIKEVPIDEHHSDFVMINKDTGIGISKSFLQKIYEPFAREHTSSGTSYAGTGLGMAITKELIDMMGGTIEIDSQQGEGTTVTIHIPLEISKSKPDQEREDTAYSIAGKHILLVDDNELNKDVTKFILEEEGAIVTTAEDGEKAVEAFAQSALNAFDVILMDIRMPNMNGLEATKAIRAKARPDAQTIPIIAMSANAFAEDVRESQQAGMDEHIAKPLDINTVVMRIAKGIERKKQQG